ncbi:FUSC family protein [Salinibacterium sp. NSLL150]|uniref:FUSC family protein n=1 Tax=unclassified Salinibacterium TaxID=2632331 RepID=UPI0018CDBF13|nr:MULTISPECIES: aromatic acid exporter family protein [unclassified Salinibacterium]MBH0099326.1 FUSC family protein [Salinibacterium sp. NSLL35]MBH0102080.1 FUSC family protein [Salinibacterium sp. NSLL150]MBH0104840.1 FUSC family protein [Salinibacterium sp. NSLL16]MBH0107600.1 FUSC family protein [Salinibacterium sp. NSLL17]MBH0108606.1 FUSC family protein [Salinibacterium sp. NG22]
MRSDITRTRMLQAAKTGLAVAIAWTIAPYLPGVADNYPYYAPLGAIVAMYPTLMGSMRNAAQTLGSLAVAIVLAGAVIIFSSPSVLTMSLAVGAGALVAATGWFGANREYIPVTVLFVLIIGGPDADDYSLGYLEQATLGIVVGLLVNLLIFPALTHNAVDQQLSNFRAVLSDHLSEIAEALAESWPPERDGWASGKDSLLAVSGEVREAVLLADESRKANPRARRYRRDVKADYEDLAALENVTFHVRDITDVLTGAVWGTPIKVQLRPELRPALSASLAALATALRDWDSVEEREEAHALAADALAALTAELDARKADANATTMGASAAISMDIARILAALNARLEHAEHEQQKQQAEQAESETAAEVVEPSEPS